MAFDAARSCVVMFGGSSGGSGIGAYSSETWQFDGRDWTFRTLEGPRRTSYALMAYDPVRQRTMMTGGTAVQIFGQPAPDQRQTWEWDGSEWTMRGLAPVHLSGGIDYMPGVGIVVIRPSSSANNTSEAYRWDGTGWTLLSQPLPYFSPPMSCAYDPNRAAMIIAAGNGTFAWDGATCTQIAPATPAYPRSIRYIPARNTVIGFVFSGPVIYELRPAGWTAITGPTGMNVSDPSPSAPLPDGGLLIFGGAATSDSRVNCWRFDGTTIFPIPRRGPIGTEAPAMAYDSDRHVSVAFSGRHGLSQLLDTTTWELRGETWLLRASSGPPGRFDGSMAYDPVARLCLLQGGNANAVTWSWNGQTWTNLGGSGPTGDGTMTWDSAAQKLVYHVNSDARPWTWNGTTWVGASPYTPVMGSQAGVVFDADRGYFIAVARAASFGTYRWTGSAWTTLISPRQTSEYQPLMVYSQRLGGVLLFGGFSGLNNDGGYPNRTYFLGSTASSWVDLNLRGPLGRKYAGFVDDTAAERIIMYAGLANLHTPRDTWKFASGPAAVAIQPQPATAPQGSAAELFIIAKGGGVISYQWRRNGQPLADDTRISGARTDTLVIASLGNTDAGDYDIVVTNACGTDTSVTATLTVTCQSDFNGDGDIGTDQDIEAFFACLGGSCCPTCGTADYNGDGDIGTDQDIESFFRVLGGGVC